MNGLKLKKVHRALSFKQSCWLKQYVDLNTQLRSRATNNFEKDFYKLMNNAVYGKTMENIDKRKDVRIVCEWENRGRKFGARSLIAKPNFHSFSIFNDNMAAIEMSRVKCFYNKPIYIGFVVLEESKRKMYDFHYNYMKPKYNKKVEIAYMDTDSYFYSISTDNFYLDIKNDINQYYDTSDYPQNNVYGFPLVNKKRIGFFKDEMNGQIILEFVGLRSKMYSYKLENKEIKKAKGINSSVLKNFNISNYRDCILEKKIFYAEMFNFKSKLHEIYTALMNKKSLDGSDDKRYICDDNINTLAWGNYKIGLDDFTRDIDF